jgi:hypothetical protein
VAAAPSGTSPPGLLLCVLVPSPTAPTPFAPQQRTPPLVVTAQEWESTPADMNAALAPPENVTVVGVVTLAENVPIPTSPKVLPPQHWAVPDDSITQLWYTPADS